MNGSKDGIFTVYHKNGNIQEKTTYKNGKPFGYFTSFFENGNVGVEGEYSEKGDQIGTWKFYWANKKIHQIIEYLSEKEYIETFYDVNGLITEVKTHKKVE